MKSLNEHIFIFSVHQSNLTRYENFENYLGMKINLDLLDIPFKNIEGCYKGIKELSFLVVANDKTRKIVEIAMREYHQESYLESYPDRYSELVFKDGQREGLGYLMPVPTVAGLDNYSIDIESGQAYTISHNDKEMKSE